MLNMQNILEKIITIKQLIGLIFISIPFIIITIIMVKLDGWKMVIQVWGFVIIICTCIFVGIKLFE